MSCPNDDESESVASGYLICTEARTGSTFLCRALASTGVLGRPNEHFAWPRNRIAVGRDPAGGLDALIAASATPNGVYGLKLFSYQFDMMQSSGWIGRLDDPCFIHLERNDLLGQAISHLRAMQTDQYISNLPSAGEPRYDHRALSEVLANLARNQARWRQYFARNGIAPLRLVYEEVIADPLAAVRAVARHVGIAEPAALDLSEIETHIQRDALSGEWRERFLTVARDLSYLDDWWLGRLRRGVRRARAWRERISGAD